MLRRRWWWVLALAVLGALAAYWGASRAAPLYRSSAMLLVPNPDPPSLYLSAIRSPSLAEEVRRDLDLPPSTYAPERMVSRLSITETGKKGLFEVSYMDPDARRASEVVNAWVTLFAGDQGSRLLPSRSEQARQLAEEALAAWVEASRSLAQQEGGSAATADDELLEARIHLEAARIRYEAYASELARLEMEQAFDVGRVRVGSRAPETGSPVRTSPVRQGVLGAAFGLAAGLLLAFGVDALRSLPAGNRSGTG